MGGWGVDALLRRVTREHHDVDLIVRVVDLPRMHNWLRGEGFQRMYDWDETRPVTTGDKLWSTAFVEGHPDGRELDVHCIDISPDGLAELATADPWTLRDDTLTGEGLIDRRGSCQLCVEEGATSDARWLRAASEAYARPEGVGPVSSTALARARV